MDLELLKLLGQFGIAGVALGVLGLIVWKIGNRMVAAIDGLGVKSDVAADRVIDKLDLHTKTDIAAWSEVSSKIAEHFKDASETLSEARRSSASDLVEFRQAVADEFATLRRDLAVLGTRLDTALDYESRARQAEEEHSKRMTIPRYEGVPRSGVPVADRMPRNRVKTQKDDE